MSAPVSPPPGVLDPLRLEALHATGLLEAEREPAFDRATGLVRRLLGVPVALVSLVDRDRQRFLSAAGLEDPWASDGETPLSHSFCQHVVARDAPLRVEDAHDDPVLCHNGAVDDLGVVAYLGVPVRTPEGEPIGALCAIASEPRAWTDGDVETLRDLAAIVEGEVALRAALEEAERRAAALRAAEAFHRDVLDTLHAFVAVLTPAGDVVAVNRLVVQVSGVGTADVAGRPFWDGPWWTYDPVVRAQIRAACEGAADGIPSQFDTQAHIGGGELLPVDVAVRPLRDAAGHVRHLVAMGVDLSERTAADAARRESEERLRLAQRAGRTGVFEWRIDTGRNVWTPELEALYGLEAGTFEGTFEGWRRRVVPEDAARVEAEIAEAAAEGRTEHTFEFRAVLPDGTRRWLLGKARYEYDAEGRPVRMIGVNVDVDELKRTEEALRESEQRYRTLFESVDVGFCLLDVVYDEGGRAVDYRFVETNPAFQEQTGLVEAEGRTAYELVPDLEPHWVETYARVAETGEPVRFENGSDAMGRWFDVYAVRVGGDESRRVALLFTDVTARRAVARALRQSERRLSLALEAARLGTFDADVATGGIALDDRAQEVLGLPEATSLASFVGRVHPACRADVLRAAARLRGAPDAGPLQFECRTAGPAPVHVGAAVRGVAGPDGALARVIGTVQDVTDRVEAQAALRESEARFRHMADTAPALLWVTEPDGTCTFLSQGWYDYTGQTEAEGLGLGWTEAVHPDDREAARETFLDATARHVPFRIDYRLRRHDGAYRWAIDVGRPRFDADGAFLGFVGSVIDIHDRKRAEEALRENEAQLRLALDAAALGTWEWDLATGAVRCDAREHEILGAPPGTLATADDVFAQVHPDDLFGLFTELEAVRAGERPYDYDFRVVHPDGAVRWVHGRGELARDADGVPARMAGVNYDVTDEREAAARLRESEERFRATFENAAVGVAHVGLDGEWLRVNDRLCEILGRGRDELVGRSVEEVTVEADLGVGRRLRERVRSGAHDEGQIEKRYRRPDGSVVWAQVTVGVIRRSDGTPSYLVSILEDISARRAAEDALVRLNADLEARVEARTAELARSNAELDQFAYVASHDLKAPLRAIDSLATWIEEDAADALPEPSQRHLELLRGRVGRMEGLLDSLLTYSRAGRKEAAPEPVDLGALVRDVVALVAPPEGVEVRLEGEFPRLVTARAPLELAVRNLVSNAIKHHDRPESGRVTVSAALTGPDGSGLDGSGLDSGPEAPGWVTVSVADDGPGIDPAYQDRVFGLFQTLRPRDEVEGSGMGLAIVKKTVEALGGRVWLESDGRGATFRFTWPLDPA